MNADMTNGKIAVLVFALFSVAPLLVADEVREVKAVSAEWSIRAGQVELQALEKPLVSGEFSVISSHLEVDSPAAPRQGGACLVADLVPFGIGRESCVTNADCNGPDAMDKQLDPRLASYVGYCASRDGTNQAYKCWTRPGPPETHCRRTRDSLRLTAGVHRLGPVDADPLGNSEPYPEWAVYACMAQPGHERACGETVSPYRQVSLTPLPAGRD